MPWTLGSGPYGLLGVPPLSGDTEKWLRMTAPLSPVWKIRFMLPSVNSPLLLGAMVTLPL
jgi:hypothetical protein